MESQKAHRGKAVRAVPLRDKNRSAGMKKRMVSALGGVLMEWLECKVLIQQTAPRMQLSKQDKAGTKLHAGMSKF